MNSWPTVCVCITYPDSQEGNSLVHPAQGRHIDGLTTDSTLGPNTSGVFTRTRVDDRIDENLRTYNITDYKKTLQTTRHTWMGFWSVNR